MKNNKKLYKSAEHREHREQNSDMVVPVVNPNREYNYIQICKDILASSDENIEQDSLVSNEIDYNDVCNDLVEETPDMVESDVFDIEDICVELNDTTYNREYEELNQEDVQELMTKIRDNPYAVDNDFFAGEDEETEEVIANVKKIKEMAGAYNYAKIVMQKKKYCILSYDDNVNGLYVYNGRCWQRIDNEALINEAYSVLSEETRFSTDSINKLCRNIADYVRLSILYEFYEGEKLFCLQDFDTIKNRIVFRNGVYDVGTGERYEFSSFLPYYMEVDCKYTEKDKPTPYYDKLKYDATGGDEPSMDMIDLMIAYLLIPNRSGKCFFIMSNAKDSGKSILGQFIESLFKGDVCQTVDPEHFAGKFAFAGAEKTALYTCFEMSTDRLSKAAVAGIKRITGERKMRVEEKYKNVRTVDIKCKLLLASNGGLYLPKNTDDDAFYRRMIVIPFIKSTPPEKMIAELSQKLQKEKSAIVSKAVRKLGKYIRSDGGIVFPESELSKSIKNSWMGKNLYDEQFIRTKLVYTGNLEDVIPKSDIYLEYQRHFCNDEVRDDMPAMCSKNALIELLANIYPQVIEKKIRCPSMDRPDNTPKPCVQCIKWRTDEERGSFI